MTVFVLLFLVSVTKQTLENIFFFFAVPYDHKYPPCTLVSKSNVTLAQPLRLKILHFYMAVIVG